MAYKLPDQRQTGCIWITREDGWALREAILPFEPPKQDSDLVIRMELLAMSLYESALRIEMEGREGINVKLTPADALIINSKVKNDQWGGANDILRQTWMVLHEAHYGTVQLKIPVEVELTLEEPPPEAIQPTKPRPARRRPAKVKENADVPGFSNS